ncbi:MAG: glycosyltransferase [Firmicutes bacterium]|nr:glycosyltransferase [Bacillota bacterium]
MIKKSFLMILVVCFVMSPAVIANAAYGHTENPSMEMHMKDPTAMSKSEVDLRDGMRKLWSDHVIWTRLFIVSSVANMPEAGLNAERLLKNQQDIGNAIKPYYGDAAGEKLADLLKNHILIAANIVTAAKNGDTETVSSEESKWIANADEIAVFLSSANPNWPKAGLQDMLHQHLSLTKSELLARLNQDYPNDIATFDQIYTQALMMADTLSEGIVKQFPAKFKMK